MNVKTMALMNIDLTLFFKKVARRLRGEPEFSDELVADLMHRLLITHEEELSCDEVFALVDQYAEASQRGEDVTNLKPIIREHLDMCRECEEEYQALLRVLEGTKEE
ncbi:MAG: hypothetical protein AB8I58_01300 [Anaerolineales bacterium]|jgi:hypothetical protein